MEIYPNTPSAQAKDTSTAVTDHSVLTADFETFLQLLTTQLKNQDPMNPMESTEYATQLATFSGVEQQVRTNELLESLSSGFGSLGMGQLGNWIGMKAVADMPVAFSGEPVVVEAQPANRADRMELVVTDDSNNVVQRVPIPLSDAPFAWTGQDMQGRYLPPGIYDLSVENWSGEELIETRPAAVQATIEEARLIDGRVHLTMEGGVSLPADEVQGVRRDDGG
jgi:flagellar basal-body rod modification protein FlgD